MLKFLSKWIKTTAQFNNKLNYFMKNCKMAAARCLVLLQHQTHL